MNTTTYIPQEIIDNISNHIDNPGDLLALALTCKNFRDGIIPDHLEYCYIRTDARRIGVWPHLVEHVRHAKRVRTLEVVDEGNIFPYFWIIPRSVRKTPRKDGLSIQTAITHLLPAIEQMCNLETFRWFSTESTCGILNTIATASPKLSGLEVICRDHLADWGLLQTWPEFKNLTQFSYAGGLIDWSDPEVDMATDTRHERLVAFQKLLHAQCPLLEDLHLEFSEETRSNPLQGLVTGGTWPNLRRLNVQAVLLYEGELEDGGSGRPIIRFTALPNIEALRLTRVEGYAIDFSALNRLRSLELHGFTEKIPSPIAHNLTSLSLNIPHLSDQNLSTFPEDTLRDCNSLCCLVIKSRVPLENSLSFIFQVCPTKLQRLVHDGPSFNEELATLQALQAQMSDLTHLGMLDSEGEDSPVDDAVRYALATMAPKLKFLGWYCDGRQLWDKLGRDDTGHPDEYESLWKVERYRNDTDYDNWGAQYRGTSAVRIVSGTL